MDFDLSATGLTNINSQREATAIQSEIDKTESFQKALEAAQQSGDEQELMTACNEFETYFINMLFKEMRKTVVTSENSVIPKSNAEEYFQEMLDEQYSQSATNAGGIGLAKFLYRQLSGEQALADAAVRARTQDIDTSKSPFNIF